MSHNFQAGDRVRFMGTRSVTGSTGFPSYVQRLFDEGEGEVVRIRGDGSGSGSDNCIQVTSLVKDVRTYFAPQDLILINGGTVRVNLALPLPLTHHFYFIDLPYHLAKIANSDPYPDPLTGLIALGLPPDTMFYVQERRSTSSWIKYYHVTLEPETWGEDKHLIIHPTVAHQYGGFHSDNYRMYDDFLSSLNVLRGKVNSNLILSYSPGSLSAAEKEDWVRRGYRHVYMITPLDDTGTLLYWEEGRSNQVLYKSESQDLYLPNPIPSDILIEIPVTWFDPSRHATLVQEQTLTNIVRVASSVRSNLIVQKQDLVRSLETDLETTQGQLLHLTNRMSQTQRLLTSLQGDDSTFQEKLTSELERVSNHPRVTSVSIERNTLKVQTDFLIGHYEGKRYALGRFSLYINFFMGEEISIQVHSLDNDVKLDANLRRAHPHGFESGNVCWGNTLGPITQLLDDAEYATMINLIIQFFEHGIYKSDWLISIDNWKTMEEYENNV